MTDASPVEPRLAEVEAKLALAEDLLDALNQTVFRQQAQLDLLQAQLRVLHRRLQEALPVEERDLRDDIPPHY